MKPSAVLFFQSLGLAALAFFLCHQAFPKDYSYAESIDRSNTTKRSIASAKPIQGVLSCLLATENTGQACQLRLVETGTGKVYDIKETPQTRDGYRQAMSLFQSGKRDVSLQARFLDTEILEVAQAKSNH